MSEEQVDRQLRHELCESLDQMLEAREKMFRTIMDFRVTLNNCEKKIKKLLNTYPENAMATMKARKLLKFHISGTSLVESAATLLIEQSPRIAFTLALLNNEPLGQQCHDSFTLVTDIKILSKKFALQQAAQRVLEGREFTSLLHATFSVDNCYDSFKYCVKLLKKKTRESQESRQRFYNGIRLGFVGFLTTILLPRLVTALETLRFSRLTDSRLVGFQACMHHPDYRTLLCQSMPLIYGQVAHFFVGSISVIDLRLCFCIMEIRPGIVSVFHQTEHRMQLQYERARKAEAKLYRIANTLKSFRELYQRYEAQLERTSNALDHWRLGVQRLHHISSICYSRYFRTIDSLRLLKKLHNGCCREFKWENRVMVKWHGIAELLRRHSVPNEPTYLRFMISLRTLQQNHFRCFSELLSARSVMLFLRSMTMQMKEQCTYTSAKYQRSVRVLRLWRNTNIRYHLDVAWGNDESTYVQLALELQRLDYSPAASRYTRALRNIRFLRKLDEYCSAELVTNIALIRDVRVDLDQLYDQCVMATSTYNRTLTNIRQWKQLYYRFEMEFDFISNMDLGRVDAGDFSPRVYGMHNMLVTTGYLSELANLRLLMQHNRRFYVDVMWSSVVIIDWSKAAPLLRSCYSFTAHNNQAVAALQAWMQLHHFCYMDSVCANATPSNWRDSGLHRVRGDLMAASYFRALSTLRMLRQLCHRYISELTCANAMIMNWREASLLLQGHCTLTGSYYWRAEASLSALQQLYERSHIEIMWANAMEMDWRQVALRPRGRCTVSADYYQHAVAILCLWRQIHQRCCTELTSANGTMTNWCETSSFAFKLVTENSWSFSVYYYARGSLLLQLGEDASAAENQQASKFFESALIYYRRAAGEGSASKWSDCRCFNLETQEGHLCVCNLLSPLHWVPPNAYTLLRQIEVIKQHIDHENFEGPRDQEDDTRALLAYLRGTCLAALSSPNRAIQELEIVFSLKDDIDQDAFLVPHAMIELAKCYKALGDNECAQSMLQNAWKRFFDNSLKSRLLSNIHSKMEILQNATAVN